MVTEGYEMEMIGFYTMGWSKALTAKDEIGVPGLTPKFVLIGHTGHINRIAWMPDGLHLASSANDGTIRIWDPYKNQTPHIFKFRLGWVDFSLAADGRRVLLLQAVQHDLEDVRHAV